MAPPSSAHDASTTQINEARQVDGNKQAFSGPRWDPAFLFHSIALAGYVRVWLWHLTDDARVLPGAKGFGWFFRYLTFYSFTLQLFQLAISCTTALLQDTQPAKKTLARWADNLASAMFGLANFVTISYYAIEAATGKEALVEGGMIARPAWLGFAVHIANTIVAWGDLLLASPRSFSVPSERLSYGIVGVYILWIWTCAQVNGAFPYPFLNLMPYPQGFVCFVAGSLVLFYFIFKLGRQISKQLQKRSLA